MKYTLENRYKVWNDETGESLEVCPDGDGLDLTEIRSITDDGQIGERVTVTREALPLLIEALQRRLADYDKT